MPTINDYKKQTLNGLGFTGDINTAESKWLKSLVAPYTGAIPDMWRKYLYDLGYTTGPLPNRFMEYLGDLGFTGSINQRWYKYWKEGGRGLGFTDSVGVRPHTSNTAAVADFDTWYGAAADFITVFGQFSNWTTYVSSIDDNVTAYSGETRPKVWTIPLNITGTTLSDAAAGSFNSYYTTVAQKILADAPASGIILMRPGHEFNIATYPWSALSDPASYIGAFRQFVACCRAVSTRFRFIWCINWISLPDTNFDVSSCYPGDAYVDAIGTDIYYDKDTDNASPTTHFNYARDLPTSGLAWLSTFAAAHGKPVCMPEFGQDWDRPEWIDLIVRWTRAHNYAYVAYWDTDLAVSMQSRISDGGMPYSGARFIAGLRDRAAVPIYEHVFNVNSEGFTATGAASVSVVSEVAQVTGSSNFSDRASRTWGELTPGYQYTVRAKIDSGSAASRVRVTEAASPFTVLASISPNTASLTDQTFTFTSPTQTSVTFTVVPFSGSGAQVVRFDNVELWD